MVSIGSLDREIEIHRPSGGSFVLLTKVSAARKDLSDGEKAQLSWTLSIKSGRFVIRSTPVTRTINANDKLRHMGVNYNINSIKETPDGRNRFLEITATQMF